MNPRVVPYPCRLLATQRLRMRKKFRLPTFIRRAWSVIAPRT